jgi:probable phosphoglycerate mutase
MTRLLLIRHGETRWNREEVFRGRADVPLSERGRKQAAALAASLPQEVAAIYASPLSRARGTAEIIGRAIGRAPVILEEMTDMAYGEWEGKPLAAVERDYPALFSTWAATPHLFRPPAGETLDEVRARAFPVVQALIPAHPDQTIALVTHRVVAKVLLCAILGLENSSFWLLRQDTCCLNEVEAEAGRFVIIRLNDTCHLRELGRDRVDF